MSEPVVSSAKIAVAGIREALAVGKEIESLTDDIRQLGMADLNARAAYRKRKRRVQNDMVIFSAVAEWKNLREIKEEIEKLKQDVIKQYGKAAWAEIEQIKDKMIKDASNDLDEFDKDLRKLRALKWWCFLVSGFCTYLLWMAGLI